MREFHSVGCNATSFAAVRVRLSPIYQNASAVQLFVAQKLAASTGSQDLTLQAISYGGSLVNYVTCSGAVTCSTRFNRQSCSEVRRVSERLHGSPRPQQLSLHPRILHRSVSFHQRPAGSRCRSVWPLSDTCARIP